MSKAKVLFVIFILTTLILPTIAFSASYDETYNYNYSRSYRRMHYVVGPGGEYMAKKAGTNINGYMGIYTNIEYRITRLLSIGFDSCLGYPFGEGKEYWSSFNPGIKIFPMMYKNPSFQPYIFLGGHAFEAVFGSKDYSGTAYGQGGFAGLGIRTFPGGSQMGFDIMVRSSFIYMERPDSIGGRGLTIPIFSSMAFTAT